MLLDFPGFGLVLAWFLGFFSAWKTRMVSHSFHYIHYCPAALLGRPLPAAGPAGGSAAREADKKVVAGELRRRALDRWTRHVAERERTGMAFYCGASAPGAVGGLRTRVPPAGCDLTGRRMLVAQRLGGHYLQSCVGAWRGAERALRLRSCPRCLQDWPGLGPPPVEDEAHYWAECPSLLPARQRMLAELEGAYPGFGRRYAALPRLDKGRALVFAVPDGTWAPGVRRGVWARGVRAVVRYGVEAAVLCPVLGQAMWRMGR